MHNCVLYVAFKNKAASSGTLPGKSHEGTQHKPHKSAVAHKSSQLVEGEMGTELVQTNQAFDVSQLSISTEERETGKLLSEDL